MPRQLRLPSLTARLSAPKLSAPKLSLPKLQGAKLRGSSLRAATQRGPSLRMPRLRAPKLRNVNLGGPSLRLPKVRNVNLGGPSLKAPKLRNVKLGGPTLRAPKLPKLRNVNLGGPSLRAPKLPKLRNVKLGGPSLRAPKLRGREGSRAPKLRNVKRGGPSLRLPNLRGVNLRMPSLSGMQLGRGRGGADVVGLDIQPGFVAAVKARSNGSIVAERAASMALGADIVRDGEVLDGDSLAEALRELFASNGLGKRVRLGVANQRTVLRTLELPPLTDAKELEAAVTFQAQDQVPMPLGNAVLDFHPLGIVDTPQGPRQRVVLVAAQRDMVERLLNAVRAAGLTPVGVDLSAFALIRSLYRPEAEPGRRVLYLNIDGLTNLAIAEGPTCRFTRVVGGGLESIASELAVRRGIALAEARALLLSADLLAGEQAASVAPPAAEPAPAPTAPVEDAGQTPEPDPYGPVEPYGDVEPYSAVEPQSDVDPYSAVEPHREAEPAQLSAEEHAARESAMSYEELSAVPAPPQPLQPAAPAHGGDRELVEALETGIREIAGEVRNSLDFHRSQEGGGEVSHIVLSGAAQDIPGFADALQRTLGVEIRTETVAAPDQALFGVSAHRLAVATGLATEEIPQ